MTALRPTASERLRAGLPALAVHALLAYALLRGLGFVPPASLPEGLKLVDLPPEIVPDDSPPPLSTGESDAQRAGAPREEGAASPPNLESRPKPFVALTDGPSELKAAPRADSGSDPSAGAAPVRGPGTGSGGIGDGSGSGAGGDGAGGGGEGGYGDGRGLRPPRHLSGRLRDRDYPAGLGEAGIAGTVSVRYAVETDGRVTGCTVTGSSGSAILDATTCRLIEQRYRYDPSRDRHGRPIRSFIVENYEWLVEDLPEERDEPPRRRRRIF